MKNRTPRKVQAADVVANVPPAKGADSELSSNSRRSFLGKLGTTAAATMAAGVLGSAPKALAQTGKVGSPQLTGRVQRALNLRIQIATKDSQLPSPQHTTNGDEQRYPDKSASYSKGLLQTSDLGVVDPAAWASFKTALASGKNSDWENIIIGGTRTQNGPQGSYCFDLMGADSSQFGNAPFGGSSLPVVPPFDQINSIYYGAQLAEQYWAALLRDVAFTDYDSSSIAQAAAAELTTMPGYRGPKNGNGQVTPDLLFRGTFPGDTIGPQMSQLMITPTTFGQQPIDQLMTTYAAGVDYMTDTGSFQLVQNGIGTGQTKQLDPVRRYLHNGRGLGAWTHEDVLYQGYLVGFLVLNTLKVPLNPGNPYIGSRTQNGFCTFGGPDFAASQGLVAAVALQRVWWQKWLVHLTHRPESGGGVLHQILSGNQNQIDARLNNNVLNSQGPQMVFSNTGTYLLPQPFPEGSPTHPSYPTGHGTVAGACITMLKFFFDGNYVIPNPQVPTNDGLSLVPYTGGDAGQITVNGELNKLARNISFGHGVHAGIHWRTDTDYSITLGEAMALSYLRDKASTYNEKFTVQIQRVDGTIATISNE